MSRSNVLQRLNLPLLAIMTALVFSVSTIAAMWVASPANAKRPGPPYSSAMSLRDDGCYSTLGTVSNISSILGGASFGLVNAIVNVPVYDWDQVPNTAFSIQSHTPASGLRGNLGGSVVGYAHDFDFKVTPVPNLMWMGRYFTQQLPYDGYQLATIATGQPNPMAASGFGKTPGNPFIANPFIYQQGAIIYPNGIPRFQVITGPLTNPTGPNNWLTSLNPTTLLNNLQGVLGAGNTMLDQNSGVISDIQNGDIQQIVGNITTSSAGLAGQAAKLLIESPLLAPSTVQYNVNGDSANDNCYESLTGAKKVPSYAFSVLDTAIPITIPGWLYSPITFIDKGRFSASGMTLYPPGSINGKDLLDCYGRGTQPIVTASGSWKLRDFAVPGYAGGTGVLLLPFIGIPAVGLGSYLINTGIAAAISAAGAAADGAAPGSGSSVATIALSLPAMETAWETYTSGMAFGFLLPDNAVKRLPSYMSNRVVDYGNSGTFSINGTYLIGSDGSNHALSQNGKQFNPDLYVKLKKPYELNPMFEIDNQPTDARRDKLDGSSVRVRISNHKTGFETGSTTFRDDDDVYRPSDRDKGGPTYNDNPGGDNRSFTRASVYRIVMKPGVIPNAIDVDKRISGTQTAYKGAQLGASTDSCNFLRQKLADGDTSTGENGTGGKDSSVTGNNANNGREEFSQPDAFQCDYAKRADGSEVRDVEIRMDSSDDLEELYDFEEKIPAETEPGTKYCYAVYYDSYGNDIKFDGREWWNSGRTNFNEDYSAATDKRFLSKAKCIISGYKPSMQVRGGDLMVNGGVYTGTNTKEFLASGADPKEQRTYGSWAEYGVIASGTVSRMGSGAIYRVGLMPTMEELGYLTFSNNRSSGSPEYGNYAEQVDDGFDRVARQFSAMSDQASMDVVTQNSVNISDLESGVYRLRPNATVNVTADGELAPNRSVILLAQDNTVVNIASNIQIPTEYGSIADISQVVVAPATESTEYRININHTVSQVDAWLINPLGTINTCRTGAPVGHVENIPRSRGRCDNTLTVNGPVAADLLMLRRNGGKDQGTETTVVQSVPGENFNLRPDAYIWAASYVDSASKKYITTNTIDLPPRY